MGRGGMVQCRDTGFWAGAENCVPAWLGSGWWEWQRKEGEEVIDYGMSK